MTSRLLLALVAGLLIGGFASHQLLPQDITVTVKPSTTTPWIEVYHNGELTSEWQPSDGAVYQALLRLLNDDLYPPQRPGRSEAGRTLLAGL